MSKSRYPHSEQNSLLLKGESSTATATVNENPHQEANSRNQSNPIINNAQKEMKELYRALMQYLNNSNSNANYFQNLINIICQQKQEENSEQIFIFKKV